MTKRSANNSHFNESNRNAFQTILRYWVLVAKYLNFGYWRRIFLFIPFWCSTPLHMVIMLSMRQKCLVLTKRVSTNPKLMRDNSSINLVCICHSKARFSSQVLALIIVSFFENIRFLYAKICFYLNMVNLTRTYFHLSKFQLFIF